MFNIRSLHLIRYKCAVICNCEQMFENNSQLIYYSSKRNDLVIIYFAY